MGYEEVKERNDDIRSFIRNRLGFGYEWINVLSSDDNPSKRCVFYVKGITYCINDGKLGIIEHPRKLVFHERGRK